MALRSELFRTDARLQHCAAVDWRPIEPGCSGFFISRLQSALLIIGHHPIDGSDVAMAFFGPSTARAIADWKRERLLLPRANRHHHNRYSDERLYIKWPVIDGRIDREAMLKLDDDMFAFERRARLADIPV